MIGRTHGVHAEPMTFGLKLALWYAEIARDVDRVRRARDHDQRRKALRRGRHVRAPAAVDRGRRLPPPGPASRRRSPRRSSSAIATPSCWRRSRSRPRRSRSSRSRSAACRRPRSARSRSRSAKGQKGSSAMPHKRNPIGCEQIVGLARLIRANCQAAFENIALWHERDISHSSVERVILPDSFIALDHMLRRFTRIVRGHGGQPGAHAREPRTARAASCSPAACCWSSRRRASRASRPTSGCSGTPCCSFAEQRDFKGLLLGDAGHHARAEARPRSSARSISTSSSGTSTRFSTRVFHPVEAGV